MKRALATPSHVLPRRTVLLCALPLMGVALSERVELPRIELLGGGRFERQDRAAVLVFFHTSCPFCARHNASMQKLHQAAKGRPLAVLGVNLGEEPGVVREYLQQRGLDFPVTLQGLALRPRFSARSVIPLTVVIDRSGRLRELIPGEMFEEDVMELLRHA